MRRWSDHAAGAARASCYEWTRWEKRCVPQALWMAPSKRPINVLDAISRLNALNEAKPAGASFVVLPLPSHRRSAYVPGGILSLIVPRIAGQ